MSNNFADVKNAPAPTPQSRADLLEQMWRNQQNARVAQFGVKAKDAGYTRTEAARRAKAQQAIKAALKARKSVKP